MSDLIDDLKVQIEASTSNADAKLDKFIAKLMNLQTAISGLEMSNASNIASGINQISSSIQSFNNQTKTADFTRVATGLNKIAGVDYQGISNASMAMHTLATNLTGLDHIGFDSDGIANIANSISKLGRDSVTNAANNLEFLKTSLSDFVGSLNTAGSLTFNADGLVSLVNSISRLGSTGASQSIQNLPQISSVLRTFIADMNSVGGVTFDVTGLANLVSSITKLGGVKASQAASNLKPIKDQILKFISGLNGIKTIDFDTDKLATLVSSITRLGGKAAGTAIPNIQQLGVALKNLMGTLATAPTVSQNLIQMTNALAALTGNGSRVSSASSAMFKGFGLYSTGAKQATKHSFNLASAIGKVYATYWMLFRAFGMIRKSIGVASDLTEVQNVVDVAFGNMKGKIEDFTKTSVQKFGMSELAAKKMSGVFMAMGNSLGGSKKEMADMSVNLTKLAGDMASFYNVEQKDVGEDLRSIFTGTVRPLRDYGIDLTQATLQEYAYSKGIETKVSKMTQLEKVQLRYNYVMEQTKNIQGDYERTSMTWANQVRLLAQQFEQLGAIVGGTMINAFKPFLTAMNSVIAKVITVAKAISDALGMIFGWKFEAGGGAGTAGLTGDLEDAADSADNLAGGAGGAADNLGDAADKAKKLAGNLQAFDHLNVISSKDDSSGSGGSGGGAGGSGGSSEGDYGEWIQAETLWDKYKSNIDSLYELGAYIGDVLTSAMNNIDWDKIYEKADNFGIGLADFLNGLISPELFGATGRTIAGCLNTALHFLDSFGTTFDWKDFGNSIATGVNEFFKTFDFKLLAHTINTWANGVLDTIIEFLDKTRWDKIGKKIGEFLADIDFAGIGSKIGQIIWESINAGISMWTGMFSAAPVETTILTALAALQLSFNTIKLLADLGNGLKSVRIGLRELAKFIGAGSLSAAGLVIGVLAAVFTALGIGLYNTEKNWKKDMADEMVNFQKEIGSTVGGVQESADALKNLGESTQAITSSAQADADKIGTLADSYFNLADKASLTNYEQDKLREYSKKLIEQCPTLASSIDGVTGRYTAQKTEIENLIKAQQEYKKAAAYEEVVGEYEKAQQKANIELEISQTEYENNEKAIRKLSDAMDNLSNSGMDKNVWAKKNKDLLDELGVSYEEDSFDVANLAKKLSFYEKENEDVVTSQTELKTQLDKTTEELGYAKEAYDKHSKSAEEATKNSAIFQQALSDLKNDLSALNLEFTDGFMEDLAMNGFDSTSLQTFFSALAEGVQASSSDLQSAFGNLGLVLPDELAKSLASKEPEVQTQASKLLMSIQSGVQANEGTLRTLFDSLGIILPDSLTSSLSNKEPAVQTEAVNLLSKLQSGHNLVKGNLLTLFAGLGIEVPDALVTSLATKDSDVQNQAIQLLGQIPAASDQERAGIIENLNKLGIDGADSLGKGIEDETEPVASKSKKLVAGVKSAATDEFKSTTSGDMYTAGANASKGFWQGIKDWWDDTWMGKKINELKQSVTGAKGLDEHSPSKFMDESGAYAGEGFNNGFQREMDKTVPMVDQWMDNVKSAYRGYRLAFPGSDVSYSFNTSFADQFEKSSRIALPEYSVGASSVDYSTDLTASLRGSNVELLAELKENNDLMRQLIAKPVLDDTGIYNATRRGVARSVNRTGKTGFKGIDS